MTGRADVLEVMWRGESDSHKFTRKQLDLAHGILLEICTILEVPLAPVGVNGMYQPEDILARVRALLPTTSADQSLHEQ